MYDTANMFYLSILEPLTTNMLLEPKIVQLAQTVVEYCCSCDEVLNSKLEKINEFLLVRKFFL